MFEKQLPGHHSNIVCAAVMACIGKSGTVRNWYLSYPVPGFLVHHRQKASSLPATASASATVASFAECSHGLEQFVHSENLARSSQTCEPPKLHEYSLTVSSYHMRLSESMASMISSMDMILLCWLSAASHGCFSRAGPSGAAVDQYCGFCFQIRQ